MLTLPMLRLLSSKAQLQRSSSSESAVTSSTVACSSSMYIIDFAYHAQCACSYDVADSDAAVQTDKKIGSRILLEIPFLRIQ